MNSGSDYRLLSCLLCKIQTLIDGLSHGVPLVPTAREGELISVDKPYQLSMVLDLMLKQIKRKVNLRIAQVREVDFAQACTCRLQRGQHR